ncbi:MAG: hypothetical protein ACKOQ4_02705, partial [Mycobacterium sp.]
MPFGESVRHDQGRAPSRVGRYVGRVGGLAVALGVGIGVAACATPVASADTTRGDSSGTGGTPKPVVRGSAHPGAGTPGAEARSRVRGRSAAAADTAVVPSTPVSLPAAAVQPARSDSRVRP